MIKRLKLVLIFVAVTTLAACGNGGTSGTNEENDQKGEELVPLEVEILTDSDAFVPGEAGEIEAKVTQGDEIVTDADEVLFEIWKDGQEKKSEKLEGKHAGEGVYSLTHTFEEDGIYYVIAHVTARDMHTMPKKKFVVGDVEADAHSDHGEHGEHGDHGEHGEHGDGVSIHLMEPETVAAGEGAKWVVHLEQDGSPLTEADVQLEYWKGDEDHQYVDVAEGKDGEYTAELKLPESGKYKMTVHVVKGDLHTHKEKTIIVQ